MRRLALVLALFVTACGSAPPPPAGEAKQTVQRYFAAFARADGPDMCRELTPTARKDAASRAHVSTCAAAAAKEAGSFPEEVRRRMLFATLGSPRVHDDVALIDADGDDMFTVRPRHVTLKLEAIDGAWGIRAIRGDMNPDPVTLCVIGGLESWTSHDVDRFWKKQGRAVFDLYMSRFCKRMIAEHVMADPLGEDDPTPKEQRAIDKLADRVIEQMLRDGSLSTD